MSTAILSLAKFSITFSRPVKPILFRQSIDVSIKSSIELIMDLTVLSTHQPQLLSYIKCQGAPLVVITGVPHKYDSAITIPKFSFNVGSIKTSEFL